MLYACLLRDELYRVASSNLELAQYFRTGSSIYFSAEPLTAFLRLIVWYRYNSGLLELARGNPRFFRDIASLRWARSCS